MRWCPMPVVQPILRVIRRCKSPALLLGIGFPCLAILNALVTVVIALLQDRFQFVAEIMSRLPLLLLASFAAGCLLGMLVGCVGKGPIFDWWFTADAFGSAGALVGCTVGAYFGYQDHDNIVRFAGYQPSAIVTGIAVGTLLGSFVGAVLGESMLPTGTMGAAEYNDEV
jgi:hypothetical protein